MAVRKCSQMGITGARVGARRYLTRSQVASLFEVSPATVARWTRQGKLPFVLTPGGQRRYLRAQILRLLARASRDVFQETACAAGSGTDAGGET